jgi:hypothetical protein
MEGLPHTSILSPLFSKERTKATKGSFILYFELRDLRVLHRG